MSLSTSEQTNHSHARIPSYVKIIILVQAATILSLTVSMYQEYLNDAYFQDYVISLFRSNIIADVLLSIVTMSVFSLGTFILLGSMGTTRRESREWRLLSQQAKAARMPSMPVLEVIEPASKPRSRSRRPRQRRPRVDTGKLYESIRYFADDQTRE
jgi:hypothetical protein